MGYLTHQASLEPSGATAYLEGSKLWWVRMAFLQKKLGMTLPMVSLICPLTYLLNMLTITSILSLLFGYEWIYVCDLCLYVCLHARMCVISVYTCMYVYDLCAYMCECVCICMHVCIWMHVCICMHVCEYMSIYMRACVWVGQRSMSSALFNCFIFWDSSRWTCSSLVHTCWRADPRNPSLSTSQHQHDRHMLPNWAFDVGSGYQT